MPVKQRENKINISLLTLVFSIPLLVMGFQNYKVEQRTPANTKVKTKHPHLHKSLHKASPIKIAAKSNSTFGVLTHQKIVLHDDETNEARIQISVDIESFISSSDVVISWKLPSDVKLIEGKLSQTLDPMAPGQTVSTSITVQGKPFEAQASFIEVYSIVNAMKLGAVYPLELKRSLESHISGTAQSDTSGIKRLNKQQEAESKYKIFY